MKILITLLLVFTLQHTNAQSNFNSLDSDLSTIVSDFTKNIKNKSECEQLKRKTNYLSDDIKNALKNEYLDSNETIKLKQLLKETEAVEDFIATIGNCGNGMYIDFQQIQLANQRINASVSKLGNYNFCIDIYRVSLNGYLATFACNKSSENLSISYKWKSIDGHSSGNGNMGLTKNSMRHIFNNRDNKNYNHIKLVYINCSAF